MKDNTEKNVSAFIQSSDFFSFFYKGLNAVPNETPYRGLKA